MKRCVKEFASIVYCGLDVTDNGNSNRVLKLLSMCDRGLLTEVDAMAELVEIARDGADYRAAKCRRTEVKG